MLSFYRSFHYQIKYFIIIIFIDIITLSKIDNSIIPIKTLFSKKTSSFQKKQIGKAYILILYY